ncbi:cornifelin homolog B isoform X2 [Gadus morhua]|uniref:cornifelin homolog B isoform X2 n=1 Tax=Gadus morhua TaxID=8049 RepID=UPI0011B436F8|nr:cornifelin homolog B-like isoform X2 [Gadus morhua]
MDQRTVTQTADRLPIKDRGASGEDYEWCCAARGQGVLGAVAPCCLGMSVAHQYGETLCLPMLPGSALALRVGIRERYKIRGSICDDWVTVCCCYPLAVSQMIREMRRRMKRQTYQVSTTLQCS